MLALSIPRPVARALVVAVLVVATHTSVASAQTSDVDVPAPVPIEDLVPMTPGAPTSFDAAAATRITHPDGQIGATTLLDAQRQLALARASLLPRVDLAASYTRLSDVQTPPLVFAGQSIDSPFPQILDQWSTSATLTVPITAILLQGMPTMRAAELGIDIAASQQQATLDTVAWQGVEAWYGWVQAQVARNVAHESLRLVEATVGHVELLAEAGVVPRIDLTTARSGLEQARAAAARAELATELAETHLRQLTGWDASVPLGIGEAILDVDAPTAPTVEALVDLARSARPEFDALDAARRAREAQLRAVRAESIPALGVSASAVYANPNQRIVPSRQEFDGTWSAGVTLSWTPTSIPASRVRVDRAALEIQRIDDQRAALEFGLRAEASAAVSAWQQAEAALQAARPEVDAARAEYDARRVSLSAGLGTTTELITASRTLAQAQLHLIDASIALHRAQRQVDRIAGAATTASLD